jgi:Uma2 family endonuclease
MKDHPQRHYTLGEYFPIEQSSEIKHEFYEGEIFAMAGGSVSHNRIVGNVGAEPGASWLGL